MTQQDVRKLPLFEFEKFYQHRLTVPSGAGGTKVIVGVSQIRYLRAIENDRLSLTFGVYRNDAWSGVALVRYYAPRADDPTGTIFIHDRMAKDIGLVSLVDLGCQVEVEETATRHTIKVLDWVQSCGGEYFHPPDVCRFFVTTPFAIKSTSVAISTNGRPPQKWTLEELEIELLARGYPTIKHLDAALALLKALVLISMLNPNLEPSPSVGNSGSPSSSGLAPASSHVGSYERSSGDQSFQSGDPSCQPGNPSHQPGDPSRQPGTSHILADQGAGNRGAFHRVSSLKLPGSTGGGLAREGLLDSPTGSMNPVSTPPSTPPPLSRTSPCAMALDTPFKSGPLASPSKGGSQTVAGTLALTSAVAARVMSRSQSMGRAQSARPQSQSRPRTQLVQRTPMSARMRSSQGGTAPIQAAHLDVAAVADTTPPSHGAVRSPPTPEPTAAKRPSIGSLSGTTSLTPSAVQARLALDQILGEEEEEEEVERHSAPLPHFARRLSTSSNRSGASTPTCATPLSARGSSKTILERFSEDGRDHSGKLKHYMSVGSGTTGGPTKEIPVPYIKTPPSYSSLTLDVPKPPGSSRSFGSADGTPSFQRQSTSSTGAVVGAGRHTPRQRSGSMNDQAQEHQAPGSKDRAAGARQPIQERSHSLNGRDPGTPPLPTAPSFSSRRPSSSRPMYTSSQAGGASYRPFSARYSDSVAVASVGTGDQELQNLTSDGVAAGVSTTVQTLFTGEEIPRHQWKRQTSVTPATRRLSSGVKRNDPIITGLLET